MERTGSQGGSTATSEASRESAPVTALEPRLGDGTIWAVLTRCLIGRSTVLGGLSARVVTIGRSMMSLGESGFLEVELVFDLPQGLG